MSFWPLIHDHKLGTRVVWIKKSLLPHSTKVNKLIYWLKQDLKIWSVWGYYIPEDSKYKVKERLIILAVSNHGNVEYPLQVWWGLPCEQSTSQWSQSKKPKTDNVCFSLFHNPRTRFVLLIPLFEEQKEVYMGKKRIRIVLDCMGLLPEMWFLFYPKSCDQWLRPDHEQHTRSHQFSYIVNCTILTPNTAHLQLHTITSMFLNSFTDQSKRKSAWNFSVGLWH